jgi:hypothetical protein
MHGFVTSTRPRFDRQPTKRRYRRRHRRVRDGEQAAVVRALTAACLHLGLPIPISTQAEAAHKTGANVSYVKDVITVLQAEDAVLLDNVLRGAISLVAAAKVVRKRAKLISALRQASEEDRTVAASRVLGADGILDLAVAAEAAV